MPAWSKVGRLVLIALRNVEDQARREEREGKRSDVALSWLNWLLKEKELAGTETRWPPVGETEAHEELLKLRDHDHLSWESIGQALNRDPRDVRRSHVRLKEWLRSL